MDINQWIVELQAYAEQAWLAVREPEFWWPIIWILAAFAAGRWLAKFPVRAIARQREQLPSGHWMHRGYDALQHVSLPLIVLLLLLLCEAAASVLEIAPGISHIASNLVLAWVVIRFVAGLVPKSLLLRWLAAGVWSVTALHIMGVLEPTIQMMDSIGFTMGGARISLLTLLQGVITLTAFLWVASAAGRFFEGQISQSSELTPSLKVLLGKMVRILLVVLAILVGLNTVGVDLTALTVFGGAVGVGLGFGLQKVVSNFVSGIILLLDRSIKPGDVIVVENTYGWVNRLSTRHVSIITRDGKEHLIPNELLITEKVENWSYSSDEVRIKIPLGVSYDSDLYLVRKLMLEAAAECPRVLKRPVPNCLLTGFGDSAVDMELRIWIADPANGVGNITSEVLFLIWDKFKEYGVGIPYPQRDLHLRTVDGGAAEALGLKDVRKKA